MNGVSACLPQISQARFSGRFQPCEGRTVALNAGRLPWGGAKAKRSPKERSAAPGRVTLLPKVAFDGLGRHTTRSAKATARLRPARSRRHGTGLDFIGAGRPMPSAQALTIQQYQ
jgi:hypothetical protein